MNAGTAIQALLVLLGAAACYWLFLAYLKPENMVAWSVLWSICT